jgi:hypothetical protein
MQSVTSYVTGFKYFRVLATLLHAKSAYFSCIPKLLEGAGLMELRSLVAEYLDMRLQRLNDVSTLLWTQN